ncbi:MAG: hypothetical protein K6G56_05920 [Clostridiales bacterium]|nr:hypothetical protein [Clostridiales bacterium]
MDNVLLKEYEVALDLKRPIPMRSFEVVEGDTGNRITATLTDGGEAVDLTGYYVMAVFSTTAGISVQSPEGGNLTVSGNTVVMDLSPDSFAPGLVECELQIYSSASGEPTGVTDSDVLVTTARFNFTCRRAILNGESINACPQFPLLTQTLAGIEQAEEQRQTNEAARQSNEDLRSAAETARQTAEAARQTSETARQAAEAVRQENEAARQTAEAARDTAETARDTAESARASAETARETAETARASAETARASAETGRQTAETARASAETARNTAETARASAETARAAAETARVTAENGRVSAETQRAADFSEMMASAGAITGSGAPTSSTVGAPGKIYLDLTTLRAYVCCGETGGFDQREYVWEPISYRREWKPIKTVTLTEDTRTVEFKKDANGNNFSYDELRLTIRGAMTGGSAVRLYFNTELMRGMSFSSFTGVNVSDMTKCMAQLYCRKPFDNFARVDKGNGGDGSGDGISIAKNVMTAYLWVDGITKYTRFCVEGQSTSVKFKTGTVFTLEGRDLD